MLNQTMKTQIFTEPSVRDTDDPSNDAPPEVSFIIFLSCIRKRKPI